MAQLQADALALPLGEPSTALHALRRKVYRSAHLRLFDKLGFVGVRSCARRRLGSPLWESCQRSWLRGCTTPLSPSQSRHTPCQLPQRGSQGRFTPARQIPDFDDTFQSILSHNGIEYKNNHSGANRCGCQLSYEPPPLCREVFWAQAAFSVGQRLCILRKITAKAVSWMTRVTIQLRG